MGYMGACRTIYKAQEGAQKEIAFRLSLFFCPNLWAAISLDSLQGSVYNNVITQNSGNILT